MGRGPWLEAAPHRNEGLRERRGEELLGGKISFPLAKLVFGGGRMSPLKARGWMGRPLSYSQPWKSPVCSRDANCLQPDTFLDLTERAEMRFKPVEAPLIPTSAGSEHVSGPILRALRENRSLLCPAHLSLAVCGRESQWLLGCQEKATSQGHGSGWSPGPPSRGGSSETPALCLEKNRKMLS